MYSSYSPSESNAVVPSPLSSFSPLGRHPRSPTTDFLCDPDPPKRVRLEPATIPGFPFEYVRQSSPDSSPIASQTSPPPPAYNFGDSKTTAAFQQSSFCDPIKPCTDSKPALAYLQGVMQPQQQPQSRPMATALAATATPRQEDYKLIIHKEPEQVCSYTANAPSLIVHTLALTASAVDNILLC